MFFRIPLGSENARDTEGHCSSLEEQFSTQLQLLQELKKPSEVRAALLVIVASPDGMRVTGWLGVCKSRYIYIYNIYIYIYIQGTAAFSPCFLLQGFHFGYLFLTHSHMCAVYM